MTYTLPVDPASCRDGVQFVRRTARIHPVSSTIQHWQLRDLIACPSPRGGLYYVRDQMVNICNPSTKELSTSVLDVGFPPTSLTTGCGFLAVGGQRSQLFVKNLQNDWSAQTSVGGSINNALNISYHCGEIRLLVSNNDETIKIYSLPSLTHETNIKLPTAVNYASVSPDGRMLVAVGDSTEVFLYEIRNGYHKIATLKASNDASFSCAWNHSSDKFAVASQDGYVSVWDTRNTEKKIAKLSSKQMVSNIHLTGACRNVKFSPTGSMDLLAFSEHTSFVHVVDARTFNEQQVIQAPSPNEADSKPDISGISFSPDGKKLFVGTPSLIAEYDVDTVTRRSFPQGSINNLSC